MIASSSSAPTRRQRSGRRHARDQPIVLKRTKPSDNSTRQVMCASTPSPRLFLGLRPGPPKIENAYLDIFVSRRVDRLRHRRDNFDREVVDRLTARAPRSFRTRKRTQRDDGEPKIYPVVAVRRGLASVYDTRSRGGRRDAPRDRELAELSRLRLARLVRGVFGRSCCRVCSSPLCAFESRRWGAFRN
jgi:hypothetical protein